MLTYHFYLIMLSLLIFFGLSYTDRATPAWWLNNWDNKNPLIAFWSNSQDSWTIKPSHYPGIQQVRAYENMTENK